MDRQIRRVGVVLMALFVLLFLQLNYLQVVPARRARQRPPQHPRRREGLQPRARPDRRGRRHRPGQVGAVERRLRAPAPVPDGRPVRPHHRLLLLHLRRPRASSGRYSDELAGRDLGFRNLKDVLVERTVTGDVSLTIDKNLQQLARDALGEQAGLGRRPRRHHRQRCWPCGASRRYDPNPLAGHDQKAVQATYTLLNAAPTQAAAGPDLPGDVRAGLDVQGRHRRRRHRAQPRGGGQASTRRRKVLDLPQTNATLPNFGGSTCGGGIADLLRVSCNTGFGQMGLDLGAEAMHGEASDFGFNDRPPIDLPAAARSVFPDAGRVQAATCPAWPSRPSARSTCGRRRCRWRSSPPASPTAARS